MLTATDQKTAKIVRTWNYRPSRDLWI